MEVVTTIYKCQQMELSDSQTGHQEISYGYNAFQTYAVIESLGDTTTFWTYLVISYRWLVFIRIKLSHNNNNATVSSTFSVLYLHKYYRTVIVVYWTTTVRRSEVESFLQTTEQLESIVASYELKNMSVSIIIRYCQDKNNSFIFPLLS